MALVGNLVSQGAGSNELRDNAFSMGALGRMAKGVAGKALGAAGYLSGAKALKSIAGDAISMQSRHLGARALRGLGLGGGEGQRTDKDGVADPGGSSGAKNNEKADYGTKDVAKNAITGEGFKTSFDKKGNANNEQPNQKKNDTLANAINAGSKIGGV